MIDYNDFQTVADERKKSQGTNEDERDKAREQIYFVEKEDGQWEPDIISKMNGKPRYTDDRCNPILDSICGEIEDNEFAIKISPSSGESSKDVAEVLEGIIRNIENISSAELTYASMGRMMVTSGMSGVYIEQDYIDGDSFDQDLFIRYVPDFVNRVWFDQASVMADNSDARFVFIDDDISKEEYESKFPDGKMMSVNRDIKADVYYDKPDVITISRCYYKKPETIEIVEMSDGAILKADEDFDMIVDELAMDGIVEVRRRKRLTHKIYQRIMDGNDWLSPEEETVFDSLPVFGCYANHKVIDGKAVVRGAIAKALDQQRVHNMAFSREVEEVVLSPRPKFWGTPEMRKGHEKTLSTLNTNANPWQDFNIDPNLPGMTPQFLGGAPVNPGLSQLSLMSAQSIDLATGAFSPQLADNANLQSGVALDKQIEKSNSSTVKYYRSIQTTLTAVGKCLVNAIPKVYDATRQQRILAEDGESEIVTLNQVVIDNQTGEAITVNDLSVGEYDVSCSYGAAFKNRQDAMTDKMLAYAAIDPTLIEISRDVMLKNSSEPGMDVVAERARAMQLQNGVIPFDQMTPEEQQAAQEAQNQPPQPDPNLLIAEAEMGKAQAAQTGAQTKQQEAQFNQQLKVAEMELENRRLALAEQEQQLDVQKFMREKEDKYNVDAAQIQQSQEKIDLQAQNQQFTQMLAMQKQLDESQKLAADTLKALKEAMGAEAIMNESTAKAYANVSDNLEEETDTPPS